MTKNLYFIWTYALPLYLVGLIRESTLHLWLLMAICVSPIHVGALRKSALNLGQILRGQRRQPRVKGAFP